MLDLVDIDGLIPKAPDDVVDAFVEWLEGEAPDTAYTVAELDAWWHRIVKYCAEWNTETERLAREVIAGMAEFLDEQTIGFGDDFIPVAFRQHIVGAGRTPSDLWLMQLLADRLENAFSSFSMWVKVDTTSAEAQLLSLVAELEPQVTQVRTRSTSVPAKRAATALGAALATRVSGPHEVLELVGSYFRIEQQARRESGSEPSIQEVANVQMAGLVAFAVLQDRAGMEELMRRVRTLAEPAGESLPISMQHAWSCAVRTVDPAFSQMIALQLLRDVWDGTRAPSDTAFHAAFLVLEASVQLGEAEQVSALCQEWIGLALHSTSGSGAARWLALIDDAG